MFLGGGCHGRSGRRGGGHGCMFKVAEPQYPGLHFFEAIALPLGIRTRGSIPNAVIFISFFNIFLLNMKIF